MVTNIDATFLQHQLICAIRPLGMFTILPLGWDFFGVSLRFSLAISIALCIAPIVPLENSPDLVSLFAEFTIGMIVALPAAALIECTGGAGEIFDTLRGQNIATAYDPLQQQTVALSGNLAKYAAWALLLASGTLIDLVHGLVQSYRAIPASTATVQNLCSMSHQIFLFLPHLLTSTITACLPFAIASITVEIVAAFIAKQLPGMPLFLEGFLAKLFIGTLLVTAVLQEGVSNTLRDASRPVQQLLLNAFP